MKRKFFISLILAAISAATWAQTQDIKVSTNAENPEHLFTLTSASNYMMTPHTSPTQTAANAGRFAFFAVEGQENQYKIYCIDNKKWISYTKAASYAAGTLNFAKLIDAPPKPASIPESITLIYLTFDTFIPKVSAAPGCSPTALILRPNLVLYNTNQTTNIIANAI